MPVLKCAKLIQSKKAQKLRGGKIVPVVPDNFTPQKVIKKRGKPQKQKTPQNPKKLKLKSLHTIEDLARSHREKQARLIYRVPISYRPEAVPGLIRDREMNVMLLDGIYLDTPLKAKYVCIPSSLNGASPDQKISVCGVVFVFKRVSGISFLGDNWNMYERSNAHLEFPPFRGVVLVHTKTSWAPKFAYDCNRPKPTTYELMRQRAKEKKQNKPRWLRERREEYREGSIWHTYTPMGGDPRYKIGRGYI